MQSHIDNTNTDADIVKHTIVDEALDAWMSCFVGVCDIHAPVKRRNVKRKQQPD